MNRTARYAAALVAVAALTPGLAACTDSSDDDVVNPVETIPMESSPAETMPPSMSPSPTG